MCREQCRQSREARDSQTHKTLTPRISQPPISITTNNTNLEWNFIRWVLRLANICVTGIYSTSLSLQNFVVSWRKNTRNNNLLIFWNTLDFTFLSPLYDEEWINRLQRLQRHQRTPTFHRIQILLHILHHQIQLFLPLQRALQLNLQVCPPQLRRQQQIIHPFQVICMWIAFCTSRNSIT